MRLAFFTLLILYGCSPHSLSEFRKEGQSRSVLFANDLKKIETREQLLLSEPILRKHFESLVDLMIEAREFLKFHPDDVATDTFFVEIQLEEQLKRIYRIEGGREIVERAQREPLIRLDAYERTLAHKKENYKN